MGKGINSFRRDAPARERFWTKVKKLEGGCWLWLGAVSIHKGLPTYGRFWLKSGVIQAHRFSYEDLVGPIPEGRILDHLCENKLCVNPNHLRITTQRGNMRRHYNSAGYLE